jgi:hypothetical protein
VVAGEQVAGVVLTLDRREPLVGLRWVDRGDIFLGGRSEEVGVGAVDVRCESPPDRFQGRASGLDDRLGARGDGHDHQLRLAMRVGGGVVGDSGDRTADAANGDERRPPRCPGLGKDLKDLRHRFLVNKCAAGDNPDARRRGRAVLERVRVGLQRDVVAGHRAEPANRVDGPGRELRVIAVKDDVDLSAGASGPPANGLAKSAMEVSSSGALRR